MSGKIFLTWVCKMKYIVFISIPNRVKVKALNEEDAKKKVYDNLVTTNQIKSADYIKIAVAIFQRRWFNMKVFIISDTHFG